MSSQGGQATAPLGPNRRPCDGRGLSGTLALGVPKRPLPAQGRREMVTVPVQSHQGLAVEAILSLISRRLDFCRGGRQGDQVIAHLETNRRPCEGTMHMTEEDA